ncbi:biofilm peroxide resistance protein BsmA [Mixta theicola]|uniref:Biofilm peroxide resistance protein BsmA n=1 Tax=Mixta theicola TaxID=1458355 RepID=A0A2K1QBD3_9GAMM|nr:biofilm peroxide resistance protein BsmA [Mixta theicola]PNS12329.1 biofilm peroxide resistance protein BsmA [Mixta theicola]GLR08086.1 biofilm peroxide resistance protein BsmA [Mixta theicola]
MRYLPLLLLTLTLSACSTLRSKPEAPPAPTQQAQEISRAQTANLPRLGSITSSTRGSPDDAQRKIAQKANQAGATYYQIVALSETVMPGMWYASAVLYGPAASATGSTQQ